jgi:ankyrin repeat protein
MEVFLMKKVSSCFFYLFTLFFCEVNSGLLATTIYPSDQQALNYRLIYECECGEINNVRQLLTLGANINSTRKSQFFCTALYTACSYGNLNMVKELLSWMDIDINVQNYGGETPLYVACRKGYVDIIDALLNANADTEIADKNGKTPLYAAAYNGRYDAVEYLIDRADICAQNKDYRTAYWAALSTPMRGSLEKNCDNIVSLLKKKDIQMQEYEKDEKNNCDYILYSEDGTVFRWIEKN